MRSRHHIWFLLLAIGCGGGEDGGGGGGGGDGVGSERCNIGDSKACDCGGITRRQLCAADGSGFLACPCGSSGGSYSGFGGGLTLGGGGSGAGAMTGGGFSTGATSTIAGSGGTAPGTGGAGAVGNGGSSSSTRPIVTEYCAFSCQMTITRGCPSVTPTCQQDCVTARSSEFTRTAACASELEAHYRCIMTLPVDAFYCDAGVAAPEGTTYCSAELQAFQDCDRNL